MNRRRRRRRGQNNQEYAIRSHFLLFWYLWRKGTPGYGKLKSIRPILSMWRGHVRGSNHHKGGHKCHYLEF